MPATDLEKLVVQLSADFKAFEKGLARANGISNSQFNAIERRARQFDSRLNSIGKSAAQGLLAPLSGIGTALGVREIAQYADAWTAAGNKIRAAATSAGVSARSLNELKAGANDARTDLETYVDLYAKLIRSASGVAKSEQEIADVTNIVSKAFKAGGASANEQAAGILQLGQALGSGVLQGDELRSLRENAPILAQAIATEFKTTVGGLKALGAEGKITSDRIFHAILAAQKPIEAQFKVTNATIADAIGQVNNEFLAYIGNADASAGASRDLVAALQYLATNFKGVADVVVELATIIIGALTGRAILGMVAGLGNAVVALGAFLTAMRAGTLVAGTFTAALGPLGLVAGAAAAALFLLYESQGSAKGSASNLNDAIATNERALKGATDATYDQITALRQLIATQAEAAHASEQAAQADFDAAVQRNNTFKQYTGMEFTPFKYDIADAEQRLNVFGAAADKLDAQVAKINKIAAGKPNGFGNGSGATPTPTKGSTRKTADDRFDEDIQSVKDRTAALLEEQSALGLTFKEQEKRKVALDLEQEALKQVREEARRKGDQDWQNAKLSPSQIKAIDDVSEAYADQADKLRKAQEAQDLQRDVLKGVFGDLRSALDDGKLGWDDLANVALNALDKIIDKIEEDLIDAILQANSASGGSGGLLGRLLGAHGVGGGGG
ncbi:phage tail tape measure protein, partial [Mesorhizobium sp. M7A.F.Ca.CA.004.01.1.1]|uniref:tape measure protein n=1 Tax=Mesorhizobium sp. M7A.F.Ca.CA.004.01.1.1 TaxID=2496689 RepID=UPI000FCC62B3